MPEPNVPLRNPKGSQFPDMSPINVDPDTTTDALQK